MNYSLTIIGIIASLLGFVAQHTNLTIGTQEITTTIETLTQLFGLLIAYIGRLRAGGVQWTGVKNPE